MAKSINTVTTANSLVFTSIKNGRILIKTGDGNRSSWRNIITAEDGSTTVKYKKTIFNIDTENKLIVAEGDVDASVFSVKNREPITKVYTPKWTAEQQSIIDSGASLIIEGTNYQAHDGVKICKCCNEEQSVENYFNKANQKDGKFPKCKACDKRRLQVQRAKKSQTA